MAGALRSALHPQRSRLILSAWLVLSACFRKICGRRTRFLLHCEEATQVALGRSNSPTRAGITRLQRA